MCHSQSPCPFERWIDSMNEFWHLSEPLEIQSHYHTLFPASKPDRIRVTHHFCFNISFFSNRTRCRTTQHQAGIRTEAVLSSSQGWADKHCHPMCICHVGRWHSDAAADVGVGTCLWPLDFSYWLLRPHPHPPHLSVIRYAL